MSSYNFVTDSYFFGCGLFKKIVKSSVYKKSFFINPDNRGLDNRGSTLDKDLVDFGMCEIRSVRFDIVDKVYD